MSYLIEFKLSILRVTRSAKLWQFSAYVCIKKRLVFRQLGRKFSLSGIQMRLEQSRVW